MKALLLGLRLAARGWRTSIARTLAMALGMAIVGLTAAAIVGMPAIFDGRNERRDALAYRYTVAGSVYANTIEQDVRGQILLRIAVSGTGTIPGASSVPAPGEVFVSQALSDWMAQDEVVARHFPQRVTGVIGNDALEHPGQLVAYVGVAGRPSEQPVMFGAPEEGVSDAVDGTKEVHAAMIAMTLFLAMPAGAFLVTSARLSARVRDRRLASLRLLGLSARSTRLVNAAETLVVGGLGAALGVGLWAAVQRSLGRTGVGGFQWFAQDAPVQSMHALGIVAGSAALAAVVATVTSNGAIDDPLATRRSMEQRVRVWWRLAVLVIGVAALVSAIANRSSSSTWLFSLLVGGAASLIGCALAVPPISRFLGATLGRGKPGGGRLLVARRLRHESTAAGRIMAGVLVATFTLGVAIGVVSAFREAISAAADYSLRQVSTSLETDVVRSLPGVEEAVPSIEGITYATCDQLRLLMLQRLPSCVDDVPFALAVRGWLEQPHDGPTVYLDPPTGEFNGFIIDGQVRPPADVPSRAQGRSLWTRIDEGQVDEFSATLTALDPTSHSGQWPSSSDLLRMVMALVVAGAVTSFVVGFGAVIIGAADRAIERHKLDANLLAVGVSGRLLRRVQVVTTALPIAIAVLLAGVVGALVGEAYRIGDSDLQFSFPWRAALTTSVIGVVGASLVAAIAAGLTRTQVSVADLRTE